MDIKNDRREKQRVVVEWPIMLFTKDGMIEGESKNLNADGLHIVCEEPVQINDIFRISLMPPDHPAIGVTGTIVWSDTYALNEEKSVYGIGICLVELSDEDKKTITSLLPEEQTDTKDH
jgi:hypothetical protein